jgi:hypothetical protein
LQSLNPTQSLLNHDAEALGANATDDTRRREITAWIPIQLVILLGDLRCRSIV